MSEYIDRLAGEMFDLLAAHADGMTRDALMDEMGLTDVGTFHEVKGRLQDLLGGSDSLTVAGDSTTALDGGWTYTLEGDPNSEASIKYNEAKQRNVYGRQRRAYMVALGLARGTDGRSAAGRAVRRQVRSLYRVLEDTVDVMDEMGMTLPDLSELPTL